VPPRHGRCPDQSGARPALPSDDIAGLIAALHQMLIQLQPPKVENTGALRGIRENRLLR
jgi:hypothetical protein